MTESAWFSMEEESEGGLRTCKKKGSSSTYFVHYTS